MRPANPRPRVTFRDKLFYYGRSYEPLAQPPSWRATTPFHIPLLDTVMKSVPYITQNHAMYQLRTNQEWFTFSQYYSVFMDLFSNHIPLSRCAMRRTRKATRIN
jgi:hypothetical protein